MKKRLDIIVTEKGLAPSREKAKALIMAGEIFVEGLREDKPGDLFDDSLCFEHRGKTLRYVSRGGLKLEKAVDFFELDLNGKVCMDVGASTGGFTDCMLQNGAARVYSVDVGYGQLDWKLRNNPRVICLEKTNARFLSHELITETIDFVSIDVSFISLTLILGAVKSVLAPDGEIVCLIKPQFEAGREKVGKKGVVRDPAVHREVIDKITGFSRQEGFSLLGLTYSPVKGPEGNIEYLLYLGNNSGEDAAFDIRSIVSEAHAELDL
ncbi:MAG: TlyA family RNA methyltransferase [Lachnospiraceae bacterium]|nr:TlyA family RNA methyltransferase [Lachnospiraceae bacterium]